MNEDNKIENKEVDKEIFEKYEKLMRAKKIQASIHTFSITLDNIAVFAFIGYMIDKKFGFEPYGLIIGIVISFPISQIMVYKKIKQLFK
jgi:F0F1-type ATP synthase assembly protein I